MRNTTTHVSMPIPQKTPPIPICVSFSLSPYTQYPMLQIKLIPANKADMKEPHEKIWEVNKRHIL